MHCRGHKDRASQKVESCSDCRRSAAPRRSLSPNALKLRQSREDEFLQHRGRGGQRLHRTCDAVTHSSRRVAALDPAAAAAAEQAAARTRARINNRTHDDHASAPLDESRHTTVCFADTQELSQKRNQAPSDRRLRLALAPSVAVALGLDPDDPVAPVASNPHGNSEAQPPENATCVSAPSTHSTHSTWASTCQSNVFGASTVERNARAHASHTTHPPATESTADPSLPSRVTAVEGSRRSLETTSMETTSTELYRRGKLSSEQFENLTRLRLQLESEARDGEYPDVLDVQDRLEGAGLSHALAEDLLRCVPRGAWKATSSTGGSTTLQGSGEGSTQHSMYSVDVDNMPLELSLIHI